MNDLISRLSEIRSNYNCFDETEEPYYRALSEAIQLASAQPERMGKWTYVTDGYVDYFKCDRCGKPVFADTPYCPNCGAKMERGD